jgi:hypothetical protein
MALAGLFTMVLVVLRGTFVCRLCTVRLGTVMRVLVA